MEYDIPLFTNKFIWVIELATGKAGNISKMKQELASGSD